MASVKLILNSWCLIGESKLVKQDRTKPDTEIMRLNGVDASFLATEMEDDVSLETLAKYVVLPRLKIIQSQSKKELRDQHGEGSAVIMPGDVVIHKLKDPMFHFVPLFFLVEWAKWRDINDTETPAVVERSFEPTSDLAKRAQDEKLRFEKYVGDTSDDPKRWRYVEHLRFVGILYGDQAHAGTAVVLSFERGEYFQGTNFISAIRMRKVQTGNDAFKRIPLWAQVWKFKVMLRSRANREWYGFDFEPGDTPIIEPRYKDEFFAEHKRLKEAHDGKLIRVEEAEDETEMPATTSEM